MEDLDIKGWAKTRKLTPTEAAFILGISHSTFINACAGKTLGEKTQEKVRERMEQYERAQSKPNSAA